jgi:rhamnosyltransferase
LVQPDPAQPFYECDITIWSGSLYKLAAVRTVGLPRADYLLDWGEFEYAHRAKRFGYRTFMHHGSIIDHNIGGQPSVADFPSIRFYYFARNIIYFWLYEYHQGNLYRFLRESLWVFKHIVNILVLSKKRRPQLAACLRGLWDGLRKNMHHRY